MKFWSQWLLRHNVVNPQVYQDDGGLYWLLNNKKKRIDWFEKHQLYHRSGMSKKHHKLLQAVYGRTDCAPLVLDACAGLGNDMFIMALGGCEVIACEKNPQVFAVLSDMIARAQKKKWFGQENINLIFGSAENIMRTWPGYRARPDVVYLDPMFEKDFKGEVKANSAFLKSLVDIETSKDLFEIALNFANSKVVVKRPNQADHLSDAKPTYIIEGKTTRYDVYQVG